MIKTLFKDQHCNVRTSMVLICLTILAIAINTYIFQYPGNDYVPGLIIQLDLIVAFVYVGFCLQFGKEHLSTQIAKEATCFFTVALIIATASGAVQYTPCPTIDKQIVAFETRFHVNMDAIVTWTHHHRFIHSLAEMTYSSLVYQIFFIPLIMIAARRVTKLREYYFLLLSSALIGLSVYYFFPTTAPASVITSDYFIEAQRATGLKFNQIHQHITPTTDEGGLVSMPSFHTIWAWFCVYLLREWTIVFILFLLFNSVLIAACVLLGWHYPVDILGSLVIILLSHGLYAHCHRRHTCCLKK